MARINSNGLLQGVIGKIVFTEIKGEGIIRKRAEKRKDTSKTLEKERGSFGFMIRFIKKIRPLSDIGFAGQKAARSTYHATLKANLVSYKEYTQSGTEGEYGWVKLSEGTLPQAENMQVSFTGDGNIKVTWNEMPKKLSNYNKDHAFGAVMIRSTGEFFASADRAIRGDKQLVIPVKNVKPEAVADVFLFFVYHERADKGITNASYKQHAVCMMQ